MTRFHTIAADPPWPLEWRGGAARRDGRGVVRYGGKVALPYKPMSIDDICELPVERIAEADAHLYLWIPDQFLLEGVAARVARAWGFEPGRCIVWWAKRGYGLGTFPRPAHEALVVCKRGSLPFAVSNEGSVQEWKQPYEGGARKHSAKPEGAYDLIERASPGPYLGAVRPPRAARLGTLGQRGAADRRPRGRRVRRRRFEIQLGRFLRIGQQWRRRDDGTVWTVAQIHRKDCVVDLRAAGTRICVPFERLRRDWKWIIRIPSTQGEPIKLSDRSSLTTGAVMRAVYDLQRQQGTRTIWPTAERIAKYLEADSDEVVRLLRDLRTQRLFRDRQRRGQRVWMPWGAV